MTFDHGMKISPKIQGRYTFFQKNVTVFGTNYIFYEIPLQFYLVSYIFLVLYFSSNTSFWPAFVKKESFRSGNLAGGKIPNFVSVHGERD